MDATLARLLELPARLGAERNRQVVLIFDEFQEIVSLDAHLPALLRSVFQEQPHVGCSSKQICEHGMPPC